MYRHFIGYLNLTGHDMTQLILVDLRNHSKDHSRNTMPNRPKTIPYLRFETLKTIPYWAETIYQSSRWICGPLSPLHVSLYVRVYCSCENMLLWQANIQSFMCGRQQRLHDPRQAPCIANGVC